MKAEREPGERRIKISKIPTDRVEGIKGTLPDLTICLNYEGGNDVFKAITLDNVVIPAIVEALNKVRLRKQRKA